MHTIKLHVEDNIYQNVMFLLKNLKLDGLKTDDTVQKKTSAKENIKQLFDSKQETLFQNIKDPLLWQKEIRDEWR